MWLVSCRKQGMLTQGPVPDPKCELNIRSFHCIVTSSDGGMGSSGRGGAGSFILGFGWGDRAWVYFFLFFVLFLCCC